jgi:phosphoribosylamine--glycine ligase
MHQVSSLARVKVLVIGSGAREHALVLGLARDPAVTRLVCAPGNPGIAEVAELLPVDANDPAAVAALAAGFDLVVIGPEAPLVAGVSDAVRAAGVPVFGPSQAAALIEGSKSFAKDVMAAAGVPTAAADSCVTVEEADAALGARRPPYVVKADGLAAGKGVLVTDALAEAQAFAADALSDPGSRVVIEDYLDGPEVSLFALSDGKTVVPMLPAQDHKRVGDGDTGPNTGGMGAYAPLPWLPEGTVELVRKTVLQPVIDEMARRGTPFSGLLYAGLAMTSHGPQVVEFNCRFGDPETQSVLALLETPLAGVLLACATGTLTDEPLQWSDASAVTVVKAAEGYPGTPAAGDVVQIGELPEGVTAQHAGTAAREGEVVTSGGRVLSVTAVAPTLEAARTKAYEGIAQVRIRGSFSRTDIAARAARGEITVPAPR